MSEKKERSDKFVFSEEDILKVEKLAAKFLSIKSIAHFFGISSDTLNRRVDENPALKIAIRTGRAKGAAKLSSVAYKKAIDGDAGMIKYLLGKHESSFMSKEDKDVDFSGEIHIDSDQYSVPN